VKDATKNILKEYSYANDMALPKWMITSIAVGVASFPYWLIRNPTEVIKTRQQVGINNSTTTILDLLPFTSSSSSSSSSSLSNNSKVQDLYTGYWENIIYAYPADVIKFVCYEALTSSSNTGTSTKVDP